MTSAFRLRHPTAARPSKRQAVHQSRAVERRPFLLRHRPVVPRHPYKRTRGQSKLTTVLTPRKSMPRPIRSVATSIHVWPTLWAGWLVQGRAGTG